MNRTAVAFLSVLVAGGCQTGDLMDVEGSSPNFAISDAAHNDGNDNAHFYFLPPLVPSPFYDGEFNPDLSPTVVVSELPGIPPVDTSLDCVVGNVIRTFSGSEVSSSGEEYSVGWQTGQDNLISGAGYRICVQVFGKALGYRDVQPDDSGANVPRNPEQDPILQFNNGSNLPIKFRIERQALCSREGVFDCTEVVLGADGGTGVCVDETCSLEVASGALEEEFLFVVERVDCTVVGGRIRHVNVDLPQFPGCLNIEALGDNVFEGFIGAGAIAGACVDAPNLAHDQFDLLQLHHERPDGSVEALSTAFAPLDCTEFLAAALEEDMNPIQRLAHRGWRKFQTIFSPVWAPEPAYAVDRGWGGGSVFDASPFVWALPAQMEQDGWTNQEVGQVGQEVSPQPAVKVTDANDDPVEGALVTFDVTMGNGPPTGSMTLETDASGVVTLPWTLDPAGLNVLEARGRGIGVSPNGDGFHLDNIPPGGDGPFSDHDGQALDVGTGVLRFEALACDNAFSPVLDGVVSGGPNPEYPNSASFTAKISGGATDATVYWTNDCTNLYFALTVASSSESDNTSLRVVFDNNNNTVQELNDDILFLERVVDNKTKAFSWEFSDRHFSADCLGNNAKSDCGDADSMQDGDGEFLFGGGFGTFEFVHPLSGDGLNDFDVTVGDAVGFYLVLQLGGGPKGNTVWPATRQYCVIGIDTSGGSKPEPLTCTTP